MFRILIQSFLLCALAVQLSAEVTVSTRFSQPKMALGDRIQYILEITHSSTQSKPEIEPITSLPIEDTDGLRLRDGRTSQQSQTRIVNGSAQFAVTQSATIDVTAPAVGKYTIPAYQILYKGKTYTAPAATLEVVERAEDAEPGIDELMYLEVKAPKEVYVGQTIKLQVQLFVHDSVTLSQLSPYEVTSNAFTLSDRSEDPEDSSDYINGQRYRVITWPITATPIRSGDQSLNFEMTAVARVQKSNQPRRHSFGSSIFDDFFGQNERFDLTNKPQNIRVKPLPTTGQPASFSGAVGNFNIEVSADTQETQIGQPIMLSLKITGEGNFKRIEGPKLTDTPAWRTYPPESVFEANDDQGLTGSKRFDYVFIPRKNGLQKLPEIKFSFFDPEAEEYIEMSSPPIEIQINGVLPAPTATVDSANQTDETTENTPAIVNMAKPLSSEESLKVLDYIPRKGRSLENNLSKNITFYIFNLATLSSLIILIIVVRKCRRLSTDPEYARICRSKQQAKNCLAQAHTAATADDPNAFYQAATAAIRFAYTQHTKTNLENASLDQLLQATPAKIKESHTDALKSIFAEADALRFSPTHDATEMQNHKQQLEAILKAL